MKGENLWLVRAVFLLPAALTAAMVAAFAVDVPFHDQFELVPHLERLYSGGLSWADFDKQHNESRILLPQTVFLLTAWLTGFDSRAQLIPSFLCVFLAGSILYRLWTLLPARAPLPWFAFLLCSLLWFGWRQHESLLWGACLVNTMVVLGVVAAVYLLWRSAELPWCFPLAILAAAGASFSQGSGLFVWPLGMACLVVSEFPFIERVRKLAAWGFISFAVVLAYFANYRQQVNPWPTGWGYVVANPRAALDYSLVYLGSSLAGSGVQAWVAGAITAAAFAVVFWYAVLDGEFRRAAVPPLALMVYVLATLALVLPSRLGLGVGQAYSSRYTVTTCLGPIAVVLAGSLLRSRSRFHAAAFHGFLVVMAVGIGLGYRQAYGAIQSDYRQRLAARADLLCFEHVSDARLAPALYPDANRVRHDAQILRRHNLSVFRGGPVCSAPVQSGMLYYEMPNGPVAQLVRALP